MMSPAEGIRLLLIQEEVLFATGEWASYVSVFPGTPDYAVVVYDTVGIPDGRLSSGERIEHPGIQILVRGLNYPKTWAKATQIALFLDAQKNVAIAGALSTVLNVMNITRTGTILPMGMEVAGGDAGAKEGNRSRYLFSINAVLTLN